MFRKRTVRPSASSAKAESTVSLHEDNEAPAIVNASSAEAGSSAEMSESAASAEGKKRGAPPPTGLVFASSSSAPLSASSAENPPSVAEPVAAQSGHSFDDDGNRATVTLEPEAPRKSTSRFGPSSAPRFIRSTTIVDYKPDVCKDYKETGYCGYGDSCIYLHDRTNYAAGNVLDRQWEELQRRKREKPATAEGSELDSPSSDNSCFICHKEYYQDQRLVKTLCGHVFCEICAKTRFKADATCAKCGAATQGVFNSTTAAKIVKRRKIEGSS